MGHPCRTADRWVPICDGWGGFTRRMWACARGGRPRAPRAGQVLGWSTRLPQLLFRPTGRPWCPACPRNTRKQSGGLFARPTPLRCLVSSPVVSCLEAACGRCQLAPHTQWPLRRPPTAHSPCPDTPMPPSAPPCPCLCSTGLPLPPKCAHTPALPLSLLSPRPPTPLSPSFSNCLGVSLSLLWLLPSAWHARARRSCVQRRARSSHEGRRRRRDAPPARRSGAAGGGAARAQACQRGGEGRTHPPRGPGASEGTARWPPNSNGAGRGLRRTRWPCACLSLSPCPSPPLSCSFSFPASSLLASRFSPLPSSSHDRPAPRQLQRRARRGATSPRVRSPVAGGSVGWAGGRGGAQSGTSRQQQRCRTGARGGRGAPDAAPCAQEPRNAPAVTSTKSPTPTTDAGLRGRGRPGRGHGLGGVFLPTGCLPRSAAVL
jgi:hypothetical protein